MDEEDRYTRITLRIPRELHVRLDAEADRTSKSLNAEIIGRLEDTFRTLQVNDFALLLAKLETSIAEAEYQVLATKNDLANVGLLLEQTVDALKGKRELTEKRLDGLLRAAHWAQQAGHVERVALETGYERLFDAKGRMNTVTQNWVGDERAKRVAARFETPKPTGSDFDYRPKPSILEAMFGPEDEAPAEAAAPKKSRARKPKP